MKYGMCKCHDRLNVKNIHVYGAKGMKLVSKHTQHTPLSAYGFVFAVFILALRFTAFVGAFGLRGN